MTSNEADQASRIIRQVFQYEEQCDPRTIALVFEIIRNLMLSNEERECDSIMAGVL